MLFLPTMVTHIQFNDSGHGLYDTLSEELAYRNEHALEEGLPTLNDEQQAEFISTITDAADYLTHWVGQPKHSILAFSVVHAVEGFKDSLGRDCLAWYISEDECQRHYINDFASDLQHLFYARQQQRRFEYVGYIPYH